MRKAERKKIDAFEMWCWRRVMRVPWMETLASRVGLTALRYFEHVVRQERGMENDVMLWVMSGKTRRGRPRTRWLDKVNNIKGPSINEMGRQRSRQMEKCYRGCRQGSDTTRRHEMYSKLDNFSTRKCQQLETH